MKKKYVKSTFVMAWAALGILGLPITESVAQEYPTQAVRIVVPFSPGGGTDTMGRLVAAQLQQRMGQPFMVENVPGAGGSIGATTVSAAEPDGYTLLLGHTGTLAINPHLYDRLEYDPLVSFTPVGTIGETPLVLVVHPSVEANSVEELISLANESPEPMAYASAGIGTGGHLAAELFRESAGLDLLNIPYKGSGNMMVDLLAGRVKMSVSVMAPAIPHIKSGALKALAVTGEKESAALPGIPPMKQAGLPDYEASLFYGLLAPSGTPKKVIENLNQELNEILRDEEVIASLAASGAEVRVMSPDEYMELIQKDYNRWGKAVEISGAKEQL